MGKANHQNKSLYSTSTRLFRLLNGLTADPEIYCSKVFSWPGWVTSKVGPKLGQPCRPLGGW